jgi:hypothetical protein
MWSFMTRLRLGAFRVSVNGAPKNLLESSRVWLTGIPLFFAQASSTIQQSICTDQHRFPATATLAQPFAR